MLIILKEHKPWSFFAYKRPAQSKIVWNSTGKKNVVAFCWSKHLIFKSYNLMSLYQFQRIVTTKCKSLFRQLKHRRRIILWDYSFKKQVHIGPLHWLAGLHQQRAIQLNSPPPTWPSIFIVHPYLHQLPVSRWEGGLEWVHFSEVHA
jgi:hypothetical protein